MASSAEEGRNAYRAGRFDEAARYLRDAVAAAPQDGALRLMLARSLEQGGHPVQAREHFRYAAQHAQAPEHQKLAAQALAELDNPPDELTQRLIHAGHLTEPDLQRAAAARRADETPLAAVLRTTSVRFSDLVGVRFSAIALNPSFERPYIDRLGMRLVASKTITQFQLKQALMAQARTVRPLGRILVESFGISEAAVREAAQAHTPPAPKLTDADSLGATLIRWGLITPRQWQQVLQAGRSPAETLVAQHLANRDHLLRVQAYQKAKLAAQAERRHRLGDVLVELGHMDRDALAKMLACQVDQPFMFGELLVMQRVCSPEAVLEGLAEQQRLYIEDAEAFLPPLEPVQPPEPVAALEAEVKPRPDRRRQWAMAAAAAALLGYGAWYGLRYAGNDYGWLGLFRQPGAESRSDRTGAMGELRGGAEEPDGPEAPNSRFDPLNVPETQVEVGRTGAQMEGTPPEPYEPFARDGAPTTPNMLVQGSELAPGISPKSGLQPEVPFDGGGNARSGVSYPMQAGETVRGDRYAMSPSEGEQAQGDPMRRAEGPQGRTGAPERTAQRVGPQGVRYGMGTAEGNQALTPPAKVPGAPVARIGNRQLEAQNELDDATVNQSSSIFRFRLGQAYFAQGKYDSARQEFLAARAADLKNPLPLYFLGRLSEQRGTADAARLYYRQYLQQAPSGEFSGEARTRLRSLGD